MGGGMGHLARSTSIAHALVEAGAPEPHIIAPESFTKFFKAPGIHIHSIPKLSGQSEYAAIILKKLASLRPKILVVDALPKGVMGELKQFLPRFNGKKALVARLLREDYRSKMGIDDFVRENYDTVIRAEKLPRDFLVHPRSVDVGPILVRDPSELPSRKEARRRLGVPADKFLVIAVDTGPSEEVDGFFETVHNALNKSGNPNSVLKFASPYGDPSPASAHTSYHPLMELLPGADLAVGHAGYHLYHEIIAAGAPALLYARPRLYDDQGIRIAGASPGRMTFFKNIEELERGIGKGIKSPPKRRPPRKRSPSGAKKTAHVIIRMSGS